MSKIDMNKKYRTRDGRPVEVISLAGRTPYPTIGYIGDEPSLTIWTEDGLWTGVEGHGNDLVEVKTEWRSQFIFQELDSGVCFLTSGHFPLDAPPVLDDRYQTIGPYAPSTKKFEVE